MRIRTIKPEFWTSEKLSAVPAETALLAIALLNYSDDEGYFNANPKLIQAALFPLRDLPQTIPVMLQDLCSIGFISVRTATDQRAYGVVTNFCDHQVINKPRDSALKALFESCSTGEAAPEVALPDASGSTPGGKEGKGREQGTGKGRLRRGGDVSGFLPADQEEPIRRRMLVVNQLKGRLPSARWSDKEFEAFKSAGLATCSDDDFVEQSEPLRAYYAAAVAELRPHWGTKDAVDFRRRDLVTLLSNWSGEVDRATAWCEWDQKNNEVKKAGRL
jgi:hypothetical protein